MTRSVRNTMISVAVVLLCAIPMSLAVDSWSLNRWSQRILEQYSALETAAGRDTPIEFLVRPDLVRIDQTGDVSLIFIPPRTAWLTWCFDLVSYEAYVIEIRSPRNGGKPELRLGHRSD